jgi:GDPmannose 4,6-dehydratase
MSKQRVALLTGISGQDGSYLAEFLLQKGYEVHGIVRRCSTPNVGRISHILNLITLHSGDLSDQCSLMRIVQDVNPDEVYNLAAQSFVGTSWQQPIATADMTGLGVTRLLEAVRYAIQTTGKPIKFYQAGSSEMFGKVVETPQRETTPFYPRSPYGVAKLYGHWMTINYRESYNMFAVSGILYNHESPRRGLEFVTRKISNAVARIKLGKQDKLCLGNLEAKRDWGFAGDYVRAMWLILQHNEPRDFVVATGQTWTVKEFVERAFDRVGLDWQKYVEIDPKFMRPAEVDLLLGDATLARQKLGWVPEVDFDQLVGLMVKADLEQEK